MFAITGATGHLGQATINALLTKIPASQIVGVVRDVQKADNLRQQGVEIRQGDYEDFSSLVAAFQGVDTVLLISTSENDYAIRTRQHQHVIDAAKQAGVRHLIYTSILNPSPESFFSASPGHFATEAYLRSSGLAYTLFRNTLYLDVIPNLIGQQVVTSGKIYYAAGTGKVSFALREDIAQALANALITADSSNNVYDIAPAPAYSMADIAATLSEVTGQPVEYVPISGEAMTAGMREHQMPEFVVDLLSGMAKAIRHNEFNTTSDDLERLLEHPSVDLKTYLTSVYS